MDCSPMNCRLEFTIVSAMEGLEAYNGRQVFLQPMPFPLGRYITQDRRPRSERKSFQPIDAELLPRLDPEYVEYHNNLLQYFPPFDVIPWDASYRHQELPGGSKPLDVAEIKDYDLTHTKVRAFTPNGTKPEKGWPVLIYFHAGGWTLGDINSEKSFITNMAEHAKCVVVNVDYRLGPEIPYPAAVEDTVESLYWVLKNGKTELNVDTTRIAVGGTSAGGNLAMALTHKAAELNIPLTFQLHVVPTVDSTASASDKYASWTENKNAAFTTPALMAWFKNNYLPNKEDWEKWEVSPINAPHDLFKKAPPAWIGVAELDVLRDEGLAYAEKLRKNGVKAETKVYGGMPHYFTPLDGTLKKGAECVSDAAAALAKAFGTA